MHEFCYLTSTQLALLDERDCSVAEVHLPGLERVHFWGGVHPNIFGTSFLCWLGLDAPMENSAYVRNFSWHRINSFRILLKRFMSALSSLQ
jgi:hypothetical protein